jgi:hypothetical protein
VSRDEPFLINVKGKPFAVVPYTLHMNDIVDYESRYFSTQEYAGDLKAEFDMLYAESSRRRRMMSVSAHDRIAGRPSRTKVLEEFIAYAQNNPGVVFMRKDEIARFALSSPGNHSRRDLTEKKELVNAKTELAIRSVTTFHRRPRRRNVIVHSLDKQRILVIGGTSGIGLATAAAAVDAGAAATIASRTRRNSTLWLRSSAARCKHKSWTPVTTISLSASSRKSRPGIMF